MASEVTRRIETKAEYEAALDEIERYFDKEPAPGTPEAERFDELARAIAAYEAEHWAVDGAAPIAGPAQSVHGRKGRA
ncbi:transcriptional regulator [Xanthobacteraceae bacterium Astr-EGSB]|uniref:transcriptional regulator n=1 Tax=Astrobacterium formosum TaxID=3069710 RepID=UPI0027B67AEA|nr:transcriptional regulator [Xanthobacteraceae bacterium Astr-EGSB]